MDSVVFRNEILAQLPSAELAQIRPALRPVQLVLGQVIHETHNPIEDIYFLESGLVSLVADTGESAFVEVGVTGRDGLVGIAALLIKAPIAVHRAIIQIPGHAFRMPAQELNVALELLPVLRDRCLRHLHFMMVQTAQTAACNARHELPMRLARWICMCRDRSDSDELPMTQEFLSFMLGVRRAGVSVVANGLQAKGLIRQSRGKMMITDRAGLQAAACTCYEIIEESRRAIMK